MELELVTSWIAGQRWYRRTGSTPRLRVLAQLPLPAFDPAAAIVIMIVADESKLATSVYQVPIVRRAEAPFDDAVIGRTESGALIDAPFDPAFAPALLAAMTGDPRIADTVLASSVLGGEQSNTSVVIERGDDLPTVAKLFRVIQPGENPDAELQRVLSAAGAPFVARFVGELRAEWPDADGTRAVGHLAIAQEFVRDAENGWSLAVEAAAEGTDFSSQAHALGAATATMHAALAAQLPARPAAPDDLTATVRLWRSRLASAVLLAPVLGPLSESIDAVYRATEAEPWPRLQRIHGDLHLGQLLYRAVDDRWVFLDFEGEPLRTVAERTAPEPALRDVAGMLRSFDYAAAFGRATDPGWEASCSAAYLEGYAQTAGADAGAHPQLLRAFELDKAVYEVVYEVRNRPDWAHIPLAAIERILG